MGKRKYYLIVFFLTLNIFVFKAQDLISDGEQAVRERVDFIDNNSDDFEVVCGGGIIMNEKTHVGAFDVCYYSEKDAEAVLEKDELVMISYHANKKDCRNYKIFLFDKGVLLYYREQNYQKEDSPYKLEIFLDKDKVSNFYSEGYPFAIDIEKYLMEVKKEYENDEFHESVLDFHDLHKK